jgi:MFS family permease
MLDLIARSSTDLSRSVAYAFFYVLTNVGGVIGPSLALLVREDSGIEYVFLISGIMAIVLAFGALLLPADPGLLAQNRAHVTVGRIVPQVVALLRSGRYVQLLLIFSGFWIMVWQVFYSLPFYVTEVLHASRFELLETVEALVVILVSVPMAALMRRVRSLNAIVLGLIVSALSWQVIGAYRTVTGAALGLAVFALGEAVVIPRFYEYVSTLAPTGQRGTVMGFVSLPIALGSVVAGPLAGYFVEDRLEAGASGAMFSQLTLIGLATAGAMFYFGRGITLTGAGDSILDLAASGLPTTKERVAARRQSCFISYSSKDSRFVNKLHNDLSRAGVKCWFAPEDLRIGDSIRARIEAKILEYDKVLVILSKHSVTSAWVEKEVETAYELERRNATRILTPLTVDNTIFDTGIAWAADIRRTRHVGDFRGWRSATKYSGAFERLLRDLTC